jgi:kynurenine 3-monooxygenase
MRSRPENITIIGAGLIGAVLAIYLARRGHRITIYERHPDVRRSPPTARRSSVNLTLTYRGLAALDRIGIGDLVRGQAVPAYGRVIHAHDGSLAYQPYGNNSEALYSIERQHLNALLLDEAERHTGVTLHFNTKCAGIDLATTTLALQDTRGGAIRHERAGRIFGADGAFSAVRGQLQRRNLFNYSQQYIEYGYKEIAVPAGARAAWIRQKNALHFWPRRKYTIVGMPNRDGSFTLSLHMPLAGEPSLDALRSDADLHDFFAAEFPDVLPCAPNLSRDFFTHAANSMVTIKCFPWTYQDTIALIGDAAHAIVPYYGQGANAGFEDCLVLSECIDRHGDDWGALLRDYQQQRKPNTDAIADLAAAHIQEISDLVNEPMFLLRKAVERKINQLYPQRYADLYAMIAFSRIPYAEALQIAGRQRALVDTVMCELAHKEHPGERTIEAAIGTAIQADHRPPTADHRLPTADDRRLTTETPLLSP